MDERYVVRLMPHAFMDLDEIYEYIANNLSEPETALEIVDAIESAILSLEVMPDRCPMRKAGEFSGKGYRQIFVKNYIVVFRIDKSLKQVVVVTVRYSHSQF